MEGVKKATDALNVKLALKGKDAISVDEFGVWLYGDDWEGDKPDNYLRMDNLLQGWLGRDTVEEYDNLARLGAKVFYEIGLGPKIAGGIDLSAIEKEE